MSRYDDAFIKQYLLRSHTMSLLPRQQEAKIVSFFGFQPTWKTSSLLTGQQQSRSVTNKYNYNYRVINLETSKENITYDYQRCEED